MPKGRSQILPIGHLVKLNAPFVVKFKRADLTTDQNILIMAANIYITNRFIGVMKKRVEIYKDVKAYIVPGELLCHISGKY